MSEPLRNALLGGTAIAVCCGVVGYFVVLRAQVFAADALSHVAFTGAVAAGAAGIDGRIGLFTATVVCGLGLGAFSGGEPDDAVTGIGFSWVLGVGAALLATAAATSGALGARTLFGSIFGLTGGDVALALVIAAAVCAVTLGASRPLLFASLDPLVAAARGVPVRALGILLMVLLGLTAAEATSAVGTLLMLGLLAAPAGAAQRLTVTPARGVLLSVAIAVGSVWLGIALCTAVPAIPPSTAIITFAGGSLAAAMLVGSSPRPWWRAAVADLDSGGR